MHVDFLLPSQNLSEAQRWKFVSALYGQVRSMVEGSVAGIGTFAVCAISTGWPGYWVLSGITLAVMVVRLLHNRQFERARSTGRTEKSPEAWARDYTIGICIMATLWASAVVSVTFLFHDMQLLMFVVILQNAWLAGAGVRNAASPAAILGQTLITTVPTIISLLIGGTNNLVRLLALGSFLFIGIILKIARFYGAQMLSLMESEQRLSAANEQLLKLSCTDGLTGIANRRAFDQKLAANWALAVRESLAITVVMIDVDYFKRFNDHHGHQAGDDCLRAIAGLIAGGVRRASDLPARYGGEEFIVLLPGSGERGAAEIAERLRRAVENANMPHGASPFGSVTISVGVATMTPGMLDQSSTLINAADQALYQAKQAGRNRVCVAPSAQGATPILQEGEGKVLLF